MAGLNGIALSDWLGDAEPLDPATMQYRAAPAAVRVARNDPNPERGCNGCIFKGQKSKVCVQAGQLARLAGFPDCEDRDVDTDKTFVYLLVPIDPRQLIVEGACHAKTST
jgi:hypothetical protein